MSGFPDMGDAFAEWSEATDFQLITKSVQDHEVREAAEPVIFDMLIVPMRAQQVAIKPEGQRSWRWWTGISDYKLGIDDVVCDEDGVKYRVTAIDNYKVAGFYAYELTEAYQ